MSNILDYLTVFLLYSKIANEIVHSVSQLKRWPISDKYHIHFFPTYVSCKMTITKTIDRWWVVMHILHLVVVVMLLHAYSVSLVSDVLSHVVLVYVYLYVEHHACEPDGCIAPHAVHEPKHNTNKQKRRNKWYNSKPLDMMVFLSY